MKLRAAVPRDLPREQNGAGASHALCSAPTLCLVQYWLIRVPLIVWILSISLVSKSDPTPLCCLHIFHTSLCLGCKGSASARGRRPRRRVRAPNGLDRQLSAALGPPGGARAAAHGAAAAPQPPDANAHGQVGRGLADGRGGGRPRRRLHELEPGGPAHQAQGCGGPRQV